MSTTALNTACPAQDTPGGIACCLLALRQQLATAAPLAGVLCDLSLQRLLLRIDTVDLLFFYDKYGVPAVPPVDEQSLDTDKLPPDCLTCQIDDLYACMATTLSTARDMGDTTLMQHMFQIICELRETVDGDGAQMPQLLGLSPLQRLVRRLGHPILRLLRFHTAPA